MMQAMFPAKNLLKCRTFASEPRRDGRGLCRLEAWVILLCLLCLLMPQLPAQAQEGAELRVRVMVEEHATEVRVEGLDLTVRDGLTGQELGTGLKVARVRSKNSNLWLEERDLGTTRVWVEAPLVYLSLNGRNYRGPVELRGEGAQLKAILHLSLESYLLGSVPGEMPSGWPMEALKAQAVVARTYAWMQVQKNADKTYDMTSDVRDQVYVGADAEHHRIAKAVRLTEGIVLMKDEKLAETFYHSTCGGATEVPRNVWPTASATQPGVTCEYCRASTHFSWTVKFSKEELAKRFKPEGFEGARVNSVEVLKRSDSGRALQIAVKGDEGSITLEGNNFRRLLGYGKLKSTRFTANGDGEDIRFNGEGFGHGAGMCQWGARGMALSGTQAEEILEHFYPGTVRVRLTPTLVKSLAAPGGEALQ